MTRKRFIKLIMGYRISRNHAHSSARLARRMPGSYQYCYDECIRPVYEAKWTSPLERKE